MKLDPVAALPQEEPTTQYSYSTDVILDSDFTTYTAVHNVVANWVHHVEIGPYLQLNTEDLVESLFLNATIDSLRNTDSNALISIHPVVHVERPAASVGGGYLPTNTTIVWSIRDSRGLLIDEVITVGEAGGKAGRKINKDHFYASLDAVFDESWAALQNSYTLHEAELRQSFDDLDSLPLEERARTIIDTAEAAPNKTEATNVFMCFVARIGDDELMNELLARGIDPGGAEPYSGRTPLHFAARFGRNDTMKILIEAGAPVDHECSDGQPPLYYAVSAGHEASWKLLLANGAGPTLSLKGQHYATGDLNQRFGDFMASQGQHERAERAYRHAATYFNRVGIDSETAAKAIAEHIKKQQFMANLRNALAPVAAQHWANTSGGYVPVLDYSYDSSGSKIRQMSLGQLAANARKRQAECLSAAEDCQTKYE